MSDAESRVESRTRAMIRARLRDSGPERDTCILDISTRGILATMANPPERGSFVELKIGQHSIVGHVKWSSTRRYGMSLHERVSVASLLTGDTGSVLLKKSVAAQKKRGGLFDALRANSDSLARVTQFAILAVTGLAAAVMLASLTGDGLGALNEARIAMNGK